MPRLNSRHGIIALLTIFSAFVCAACDSSSPLVGGQPPVIPGGTVAHTWVGGNASSADLVQITVAGGQITGTLDETDTTPGGTDTKSHHLTVGGTLQGTGLALTLGGDLQQISVFGTLTSDTMTLNAPSASGTIETTTLKPGTIDGYNTLVAQLQGGAATTAADQQQAAAISAQQAAVDKAATVVESDYQALAATLKQGMDFSAFKRDLKNAQGDLAKAHTDASAAQAQGSNSDGCYTASSAEYDASSVQYDQSSVQYDNTALQSTLQPITAAVSALKTDWTTYQQAQALQPQYNNTPVPTDALIAAVEAQADRETGQWTAAGQSYQSQVDGMQTEAQRVADKAQSAVC